MEETPKKSKAWIWFIVLAAIIIAAALWQTRGSAGWSARASQDYQAVFLTNDQVYFGKLTSADSQYPRLRDVYYLQVTQTLQPPEQTGPAIPNINLVKLGGELHGPTDEMVINRDHILFYEDMKPDSQVVTAINQFKEAANQ
jgi:hypothetical protein